MDDTGILGYWGTFGKTAVMDYTGILGHFSKRRLLHTGILGSGILGSEILGYWDTGSEILGYWAGLRYWTILGHWSMTGSGGENATTLMTCTNCQQKR